MDLMLSDDQRDIVSSVRQVLARRTTPAGQADYEPDTLSALSEAGFLDVATNGGTLLDAVLVVEEVARAGVTAPVAAQAIVAALLPSLPSGAALALVDKPDSSLVRFADQCDAAVVAVGRDARLVLRQELEVTAVGMRWGYPVARVTVPEKAGERVGSSESLLQAWRIALSAEAAGLMLGAVHKGAEYVGQRYQFGKPIGIYQSVQHRLARALVVAEGTRWLARRAAWCPADEVQATAAACYAADGMREVFRNVHQVVGAMGITDEFGLTRLTAKLAYLHTELGGASAHAIAHTRARWPRALPAARDGDRATRPLLVQAR